MWGVGGGKAPKRKQVHKVLGRKEKKEKKKKKGGVVCSYFHNLSFYLLSFLFTSRFVSVILTCTLLVLTDPLPNLGRYTLNLSYVHIIHSQHCRQEAFFPNVCVKKNLKNSHPYRPPFSFFFCIHICMYLVILYCNTVFITSK